MLTDLLQVLPFRVNMGVVPSSEGAASFLYARTTYNFPHTRLFFDLTRDPNSMDGVGAQEARIRR